MSRAVVSLREIESPLFPLAADVHGGIGARDDAHFIQGSSFLRGVLD